MSPHRKPPSGPGYAPGASPKGTTGESLCPGKTALSKVDAWQMPFMGSIYGINFPGIISYSPYYSPYFIGIRSFFVSNCMFGCLS